MAVARNPLGPWRVSNGMHAILTDMKHPHNPTWLRLALAVALVALLGGPPALAGGKGSDIGGPPREDVRSDRARFGIEPASLTDEEKQVRLEIIEKEYEDLKRNQDLLQVRTRRNRVTFVGEMRYQPSAKFLRKVFDGDRDVRARVGALVAIGKAGDLDAIQYVVKKALSSARKDPVYASSLARMFAGVQLPEAKAWIVTRLKQKDPAVLATVVEAVGYGGHESALPELVKILDTQKDPTLKFETLRAYGRCGGRKAISKLLVYLSNEDWRLRMAAAEGLGFTGDASVIEELKRLIIRGEEPIVTETAIEAVGRLGTRDAIEPLIDGLKVGRLRARQKARNSLVGLAHDLFRQDKDYHVDPNSWTAWWKKVQRGVDPDDETFNARETASYFEFPIQSDRVLFILDVSGSMKWPDAPRTSGIKPSAWDNRRIDLAHRELFKALRALAKQNQGKIPEKRKRGSTDEIPFAPDEDGVEPPTLFNVATFAGVVTQWQKDVVLADEKNVEAAIAWFKKQLPRGGTATFDALEFGILANNVDTVYFLSDGVPSLGRFEEPETILSELRKVNRFKRVSINTIALIVGKAPIEKALKYEDPDEMADFMSRIATENQGWFADESRP